MDGYHTGTFHTGTFQECDRHGRTVANSAGMLIVMEHNRDHIRASDDCPTCRRRFASDQEKASTLQIIDDDIMVRRWWDAPGCNRSPCRPHPPP